MSYWTTSLEQTVGRLGASQAQDPGSFGDWLRLYAEDAPATSNQGSANVPFQRWFKFKEAFSPKFVADTISAAPYEVTHCLDPFAGSGTTALTCSFLGIASTSIEVNPFLADVVTAKVNPITANALYEAYAALVTNPVILEEDRVPPPEMPATLREPGRGGRHVFAADVFDTTRMLARRARALSTPASRLLLVLLGSVLVDNSNVVVNGKGRRYRSGWEGRRMSARNLLADLDRAVSEAAADLICFARRPQAAHRVVRGDARTASADAGRADLSLFSPPYPNSFDYTDVYNLELWMLGYLDGADANGVLRRSTLRSHVQIQRPGRSSARRSPLLAETVGRLTKVVGDLWNPRIPDMVDAYFEDLDGVLAGVAAALPSDKRAVMVVGDCQYGGVRVDVAGIIEEGLAGGPFKLHSRGAVRSMRTSAQHGGGFELQEHCIVLERI